MIATEDVLFGGVAANRGCGDCIECCRALNIRAPELLKPAGELCRTCTGTGCGMYEQRPSVCRTWHCVWRYLDPLPDELRPDRCGVLFYVDQQFAPRNVFENLFLLVRADDPARFARPEVGAAIDMFVRHGLLPVWLGAAGTRKLVYPAEPLASAIFALSNGEQVDGELMPTAADWLKRYLALADRRPPPRDAATAAMRSTRWIGRRIRGGR